MARPRTPEASWPLAVAMVTAVPGSWERTGRSTWGSRGRERSSPHAPLQLPHCEGPAALPWGALKRWGHSAGHRPALPSTAQDLLRLSQLPILQPVLPGRASVSTSVKGVRGENPLILRGNRTSWLGRGRHWTEKGAPPGTPRHGPGHPQLLSPTLRPCRDLCPWAPQPPNHGSAWPRLAG